MKLSLSHSYRFEKRGFAFLAGLLQTTSVLVLESVNIIALVLIDDYISMVSNFLALYIVS